MTETPEKQREEQEQAAKQGGEEDGRATPPDDLSEDPAYEPEDEGLKGIKGG